MPGENREEYWTEKSGKPCSMSPEWNRTSHDAGNLVPASTAVISTFTPPNVSVVVGGSSLAEHSVHRGHVSLVAITTMVAPSLTPGIAVDMKGPKKFTPTSRAPAGTAGRRVTGVALVRSLPSATPATVKAGPLGSSAPHDLTSSDAIIFEWTDEALSWGHVRGHTGSRAFPAARSGSASGVGSTGTS